MKKFLMSILFMAVLLVPITVKAEDEVTIYLFRGDTCAHCEEAITYINKHKDELGDNIKVVTYEVWENEENSKLQDKVADKLEVDKEKNYGVPFIVIGEEYIKGYGGVSTFNKMLDIANDYVSNGEYKDIVAQTAKEEGLDVKSKTLDELFSEPSKVVTIVAYSIFGAIVLGIGAMIVFSRK